jgi:hypothetical protein
MRKPPKNYRAIRPRCCWNCLYIRSDSDGWFCSLIQGPIWSEFDGPFNYICDLFIMRPAGAIRDIDIEAENGRRESS